MHCNLYVDKAYIFIKINETLNNTTGSVSMSIKNNYAVHVAIFYNTKDVELKGSCFIFNSLSVLGKVVLGNTLFVNADGYNGSIRCVPPVDTAESSLTFYKYKDMRFGLADDMWLMGQNYWFNGGYSIGTPVLGMCFNIGITGIIRAAYKMKSPELMNDIIRGNGANQITIDDNVIITGTTIIHGNSIMRRFTYEFSPVAIPLNTNTTLTYAHLRNGISTGLNVASGLNYTLPLGTLMGANMAWLGDGTISQYGQSFQWTIINMSSYTGNIAIVSSLGHSCIGNTVLTTNASFMTLNTAITYRICNLKNNLLNIILI